MILTAFGVGGCAGVRGCAGVPAIQSKILTQLNCSKMAYRKCQK